MRPARVTELTAAQVNAMRVHAAKGGAGLAPAFVAAKVRSIRKRLGLSQASFAALLRVPTATVQNWEQGRRKPEGPALSLLLVTDRAPDLVLTALHGRRRRTA
ncbi:MAG: helix-turn-helix domain-containing protein [Planctomycetes bacterium]|nr:helix-turn-helix domain-containing protein [Planctomycetota bacterium]